MTGARRLLLLVALAAIAVVPLRAFGVVGAETSGGLSVRASLGGCGISGSEIVCEIGVSFSGVAGADYYTASVTRADGSVQDAGTVGSGESGGSSTIYVPYVGSGTYTVTVSAWGTADDGGEPELLDSSRAGADEDGEDGEASAKPAEPAEPEAAEPENAAPPEPAKPAQESQPAQPETEKLPECQPDDAEAEAAEAAAADSDAQAGAAPPESLTAPAIECWTPASDSRGPCCPPAA